MTDWLNRLVRDWPERHPPFRDDFATEPKAVKNWLNHLPLANPAATGRQLLDALMVMNRMRIEPQQRLETLELLRGPVLQVIGGIDRLVLVESFPLPPAKLQQARAAQDFEREIGLGYLQALHDFCAPGGKVPFLKGKSVATAAVRALQHYGGLLAKAYALYHTPPAGVWLRLHDIHAAAAALRVDDKGITDPHLGGAELSPRHAYAHALLLALSNPYRYTQREMGDLVALTRALAPFCQISQGRGKARGFAVLIDADQGVGYVPEERHDAEEGLLSFDPQPVQQMVEGQLRLLPGGAELLSFRLKGGPSVQARRSVVERLMRSWGGSADRGHARLAAGHQLDTVIGLHALHHMLAGNEDFDIFLRRVRGQAVNLSDRDSMAPWASQSSEVKPVVQRARVLDQSLGGYRLVWDKADLARAKVGELVGLAQAAAADEDDEDLQDWMVGVIRWIRIDDADSVDAGVELLARRAQPVGIASFEPTGPVRAAMRGVLLLDQDNGHAMTVLAPHLFDRHAHELELTRPADPLDWQSRASVARLGDVTVVDASAAYQRVLIGRAPTQEELAESEAAGADEPELLGSGTAG
jgi:cyclic-di-GMP-binding protein